MVNKFASSDLSQQGQDLSGSSSTRVLGGRKRTMVIQRVAFVTVLVVLASSVTVATAKSTSRSSHRIKGGGRPRNDIRQLQIPVVKENNSRKRNAGLWQVFDQVVRMLFCGMPDFLEDSSTTSKLGLAGQNW
jgi:hypothetical protein